MDRRAFLASPLVFVAGPGLGADVAYPPVVAGRALVFPRDHGGHGSFRTEWWYLTGWLSTGERELGFQVTFFRNRPGIGEDSSSRFAPTQLLFAHAALADVEQGRLLHDQRSARAGFGLAGFEEADTAVHIGDWALRRSGNGYQAGVAARGFDLSLEFEPKQGVLLQGHRGYSRKGPRPRQASYYYSWPQLAVRGTVTREGRAASVEGVAWLDHEWSTEALAPEAAGWDWCGINGDDGSALMAFRIRGRDGATYWAGGSARTADGRVRIFEPGEVKIEPLRTWRSSRSGNVYPVAVKVQAPGVAWTLAPLMDDQEVDAWASTGTVYWEGAVRATSEGRRVGRGYLELTGYGRPLRL